MEPPMRLFAAVLCLALSLSAAAAAAPGWIRPEVAYSATRTMTVGGHEISGPLHYDDGKERFEMSMDGARHIMIRREDRQRVYMVMPDMGMAMAMVFDGSNGLPSAGDYADLPQEEMGRETIGGAPGPTDSNEARHARQRDNTTTW